MNYSRYTKDACENDDSKVRELLNDLNEAIVSDLGDCVANRMSEIAEKLNAQGHNLKRNNDLEDLGSTDFCETHGDVTCGFRVGTDLVVSLGYYGISYADPDIPN